MQYLATFASILSLAAATTVDGNWTLYCGSSCDSATEVASGTLYDNDACTSLSSTYDYCRFEGTDWFRLTLSPESGCGGDSVTIDPGDCSSAGSWVSHETTAIL